MAPATQLSFNKNWLELLHLFPSFRVVFRIILRRAGGSQACSFRPRFIYFHWLLHCKDAQQLNELLTLVLRKYRPPKIHRLQFTNRSTVTRTATVAMTTQTKAAICKIAGATSIINLPFTAGYKNTWAVHMTCISGAKNDNNFISAFGLHKDVRLMFPTGDAVATALHAGLPPWSRLLIDLKKTFQWTRDGLELVPTLLLLLVTALAESSNTPSMSQKRILSLDLLTSPFLDFFSPSTQASSGLLLQTC